MDVFWLAGGKLPACFTMLSLPFQYCHFFSRCLVYLTKVSGTARDISKHQSTSAKKSRKYFIWQQSNTTADNVIIPRIMCYTTGLVPSVLFRICQQSRVVPCDTLSITHFHNTSDILKERGPETGYRERDNSTACPEKSIVCI